MLIYLHVYRYPWICANVWQMLCKERFQVFWLELWRLLLCVWRVLLAKLNSISRTSTSGSMSAQPLPGNGRDMRGTFISFSRRVVCLDLKSLFIDVWIKNKCWSMLKPWFFSCIQHKTGFSCKHFHHFNLLWNVFWGGTLALRSWR